MELRVNLIVDVVSYSGVEKLKYLGCVINNINCGEVEIKSRIKGALRSAPALYSVLVYKIIRRKTKLCVFRTVKPRLRKYSTSFVNYINTQV